MTRKPLTSYATLAILILAPSAHADFANGPDPYADGFGFDAPDSPGALAWGGWARGAPGTVYAEWDQFFNPANPASPDVGSAGTPAASFAWNSPTTFAAGSGNLYSFSGASVITVTIAGSDDMSAAPLTVALQTETWGTPLEFDDIGTPLAPVTLNGLVWDSKLVTYQDAAFDSVFGPVLLEHALFVWTLDGPLSSYDFVLTGGPHMSFAQLAVDIGPVPLPAAVWLLGPAAMALVRVRRKQAAVV